MTMMLSTTTTETTAAGTEQKKKIARIWQYNKTHNDDRIQ